MLSSIVILSTTTTIPGSCPLYDTQQLPHRKEWQPGGGSTAFRSLLPKIVIPVLFVLTDNSSTKQKQDGAFGKIKKEGTGTRG
jgi:hypothetical protein